MFAPEGFGVGRFRLGLRALTKVEADELPGFDGGTGLVAVVADAGKAFGQDVGKRSIYPLCIVGRDEVWSATYAAFSLRSADCSLIDLIQAFGRRLSNSPTEGLCMSFSKTHFK